jgi:hypothetical protein
MNAYKNRESLLEVGPEVFLRTPYSHQPVIAPYRQSEFLRLEGEHGLYFTPEAEEIEQPTSQG